MSKMAAMLFCSVVGQCRSASFQPQMFFILCLSVFATIKQTKICYILNTSELYAQHSWIKLVYSPHSDSSHGYRGLVEQKVRFKKKFLNLFQINQLPLEWKFMQLTLFRCRYLVHALEITVRGGWKPQTRAMERIHALWCMYRCYKTANKKLECVHTMFVPICL